MDSDKSAIRNNANVHMILDKIKFGLKIAEKKSVISFLQLLGFHYSSVEDGVQATTEGSFEPVAVNSMLLFKLSDERSNVCRTFHPSLHAFNGSPAPSFIALKIDVNGVAVSIVTIAKMFAQVGW